VKVFPLPELDGGFLIYVLIGSYAASDKQTPPATTTAVTTPQERSPLQQQAKSNSKVKPDPSRPATPEQRTVRGNRSGDIEMKD